MSPFFTSEKRPPLGIGFLISVLRDAGHKVFFIDNYLRPSDFLETGYLVEIWRGKIAVGGPHTSADLESIPDFVDHGVIGEGERAILNIVEGTADRIVQEERIRDLDQLPMSAYDYFATLPYDFSTQWFPEQPVFTMNTSRGCPFQCAFCSVGSVWGQQYRSFSAGRVI